MTTPHILMYSTPWCPFCIRARHLLESKGLAFDDIDVSRDPQQRQKMEVESGQHTVPQIWINQRHVGGCDDLYALERNGELDSWLNSGTP